MVKESDKETLDLISDHLKFIKEKYNPEKIIIFGNRAKGDKMRIMIYTRSLCHPNFKGWAGGRG